MSDDPSSSSAAAAAASDGRDHSSEGYRKPGGFRNFIRSLLGRSPESNLRDTFEELLEEHEERETPIDKDERALITNILNVGEMTAYDVMVPRADIASIDLSTPLAEVIDTVVKKPHSRYPVYRETLDDVVGMVHIKDVLKATQKPAKDFSLEKILRKVLFVAPSMRVLDLLLQMRMDRLHMALVVDEYGGIDGIVTIEDLVEEIVGEIEDEHDVDRGPRIERKPDGSWIADARMDVEDIEERFGQILTEEERDEDIDTLGGLVFSIAGRVPTRGELIQHEATGIEFEVLEADPRRIKRLRIRNMPEPRDAQPADG